MENTIEELYVPLLMESGFVPEENNKRFGPMGVCWRSTDPSCEGYYWIYDQKDLFRIKIHDFYYKKDAFLEFHFPECLSITYYESISGEETAPQRRLSAGCVKSFIGGQGAYSVFIHKMIPIRSIGIEITPAYYEGYLKEQYPDETIDTMEAFQFIDQTEEFPEMVGLLMQVQNYRGEGIAARLFYESKVAEAVSLVVGRYKQRACARKSPLPPEDRERLQNVSAYINQHYASHLPLSHLSKIACMGSTKLKMSFRQLYGCTITQYIQNRRMSQAEYLLASTSLSIGQIAQAVGYQKASHFSGLFRKNTGYLPSEYRKMTRKE